MSHEYQLDTKDFHSLKTASQKMFNVISERLNVQTAYVTKRGETAMTVLSSFNREEEIIPEGYSVEYGGTYCRYIINNKESSLTTDNLMMDELTRDLEVSSQLQVKGFLGVTLVDTSGEVFGTLCVMDKEEKNFSDQDIKFLKSMADVLSHLIELDQTQYNMALLNVPIIPITKGVAIFTIQGIIDQHRADKIMKNVLEYGVEHDVDYFIIDLTGLVILDKTFPKVIVNLVQALEVMGIQTIMTGITPEIAQREMKDTNLIKMKTKTVCDLESALSYIGFTLIENQSNPV
ncbi:STAS domain-containing protein [Halobacillus litoralis]|uniref:STAS domain-containing protein n=1 Tax=Halobacillus litoralis TaxID=45668 RepID=UPI001CFCA853|nr:STAS domain-containing protein [Halobacillus litoralis]